MKLVILVFSCQICFALQPLVVDATYAVTMRTAIPQENITGSFQSNDLTSTVYCIYLVFAL